MKTSGSGFPDGRLYPLPKTLRRNSHSGAWILRRTGYHLSGTCCATRLGGTLYQRNQWIRCPIFFWMQPALLLLPECRHQPPDARHTRNRFTASQLHAASGTGRGSQLKSGHRNTVCPINSGSAGSYQVPSFHSSYLEYQRL